MRAELSTDVKTELYTFDYKGETSIMDVVVSDGCLVVTGYVSDRLSTVITPITDNPEDTVVALPTDIAYVYSVAYLDVEEERYYSEPVKYSVLDYAYIKLGYTGTASDNQYLKDMLSSMLDYGADAQKYFNYNTDNALFFRIYQNKGLHF
jgi:hypothetical protein